MSRYTAVNNYGARNEFRLFFSVSSWEMFLSVNILYFAMFFFSSFSRKHHVVR